MSKCKWIGAKLCDCDKIFDFEVGRLHKIFGEIFCHSLNYNLFTDSIYFIELFLCLDVKRVNGMMNYAIKYRDEKEIQFLSSDQAVKMWPAKVLSFLKKNITFVMPTPGLPQPMLTEINTAAAIGKPAMVLACTDTNGKIEYIFQWENGFSRKIASDEYPDITIRYLESKIDFGVVNPNVGNFIYGNYS